MSRDCRLLALSVGKVGATPLSVHDGSPFLVFFPFCICDTVCTVLPLVSICGCRDVKIAAVVGAALTWQKFLFCQCFFDGADICFIDLSALWRCYCVFVICGVVIV